MASAGCVVVTGAASGIGNHITMELVMKGRTTVLWDVDQVRMESEGLISLSFILKEGLDLLEKELSALLAGIARGYLVDITNYEQVAEVRNT